MSNFFKTSASNLIGFMGIKEPVMEFEMEKDKNGNIDFLIRKETIEYAASLSYIDMLTVLKNSKDMTEDEFLKEQFSDMMEDLMNNFG